MPIQKTKPVMSQAQPIVVLRPQTPMPVATSFVIRAAQHQEQAAGHAQHDDPQGRRLALDDAGHLLGDVVEGLVAQHERRPPPRGRRGGRYASGRERPVAVAVVVAPIARPSPTLG